MREAIGGTWIFQIVIFFILLFTGFMCLSINHSKAFNVKSEILEIIERYNGMDLDDITTGDAALTEIVETLNRISYRTTGKCPNSITDPMTGDMIHYVGFNREGHLDSVKPAFCIAKVETRNYQPQVVSELPSLAYYRIIVFYQLDLPIFHDVFNFNLKGDTKIIKTSR